MWGLCPFSWNLGEFMSALTKSMTEVTLLLLRLGHKRPESPPCSLEPLLLQTWTAMGCLSKRKFKPQAEARSSLSGRQFQVKPHFSHASPGVRHVSGKSWFQLSAIQDLTSCSTPPSWELRFMRQKKGSLLCSVKIPCPQNLWASQKDGCSTPLN